MYSLPKEFHSKQDATKKEKSSPDFPNLPQIFLESVLFLLPEQWKQGPFLVVLQATAHCQPSLARSSFLNAPLCRVCQVM